MSKWRKGSETRGSTNEGNQFAQDHMTRSYRQGWNSNLQSPSPELFPLPSQHVKSEL